MSAPADEPAKKAEETATQTETPAAEESKAEPIALRKSIFVRGLAFSTRELTLARHIETVAPVDRVHILTGFRNRSKGSAFVHLTDPNQIDEVVEKLNGKPLEGRYLEISRAKPFSELPPSRRRRFNPYRPRYAYPPPRPYMRNRRPPPPPPAYQSRKRDVNPSRTKSEYTVAVLNLPYVASEEDMDDIFEEFDIVDAKICRTADGVSKGVAFVTFISHEEQQLLSALPTLTSWKTARFASLRLTFSLRNSRRRRKTSLRLSRIERD